MKINKSKLNSKGFSHVEMLIALVVIVAIAGVGVFVYKHHKDSNKSMSSTIHPMGFTTKPLVNSSVKGSSALVDGKSLASVVPSASAMNLSEIDAGAYGVFPIYACKTVISPFGAFQVNAFYWKPAASPNVAAAMQRVVESNEAWHYHTPTISKTYAYNLVTEISNTYAFTPQTLNSNAWVSMKEYDNDNKAKSIDNDVVSANSYDDTDLFTYIVNC